MRKRFPESFEITIDHISPGGEAVGYFENREIHCFGALEGERVLLKPLKRKKKVMKAEVIELLSTSDKRIAARDDHFVSSSPYQIISEQTQEEWNTQHAVEYFNISLGENNYPKPEYFKSDVTWNYRNKMEFSIATDETGKLSLALHKRFRSRSFYFLKSCAISHPKLFSVAKIIEKVLQESNISSYTIKSLVVRYSYKEDACIASLYVTEENFPRIEINDNKIKGWQIIFSNPLSPASLTTNILFSIGDNILKEDIDGQLFTYGYESFFQAYPPSFNKLMQYIKNHIQKGSVLLDLYAGVGTIGFCLHSFFKNIISLEYNEQASKYAKDNALLNQLSNVTIINALAEKTDLEEILQKVDCLIVDPPRSGLHPKVVQKIKLFGPKNFIYISCNPKTQATDMIELSKSYQITKWAIFDLYPQTPHLESVLILTHKS